MPLMTRRSSTRSSFSQNRFLRTIPIPSKNESGSYCQSGKLMSSDPSLCWSQRRKSANPIVRSRCVLLNIHARLLILGISLRIQLTCFLHRHGYRDFLLLRDFCDFVVPTLRRDFFDGG